ncbi:hypothetical protein FG386_001210 [Cryptosporidium ryanae]|uniref:uncharacterized protein n=1 Tax=Cryptosporidium ryanae TaxID=515981 RepID=UPI00351A632F|nr:hypothetical protein FG386_001210 [Cryptosporidium ryanae]
MSMTNKQGEKVELQVYDLSNGMASQLSPMLLGKTIEAIYHTGVLVYGYEYFYGGGIVCVKPEEITRLYGMKPIKTLTLGFTSKNQIELNTHLESISSKFTSENYDLLNHNCNHFSDNIVKFLLGDGIPSYILDLPNEVMRTPFGSMLLPMLQKAQKSQAVRSVANVWNTNGISPSNVINKTAGEINNLSNSLSPGSRSKNFSTDSSQLSMKLDHITRKYGWNSQRILETLETILENIVRNPTELRYRSIKATSNTLKTVLKGIDEGLDLLFTLGFHEKKVEDQDKYEIHLSHPITSQEREDIENKIKIIRHYLSNLRIQDEEQKESIFESSNTCNNSSVSSSSNSLADGNQQVSSGNDADSEVCSDGSIDYIKLLEQVKSMGFNDNQRILRALHSSRGDISQAIDILVNQQS